MEIASIERLPKGSDADVRVCHCSSCHHEMLRLTVWATAALLPWAGIAALVGLLVL